jgi:hypothetical protein
MASTTTYDAESQMAAGAGLHGNQNGETPPAQQQQQQQQQPHAQMHVDDLQLEERIQHLQRGTEMMYANPQGHQINAALNAHHQFQTPPRPTHSPQQMAQHVMSLDGQDMYSDHDGSSRKRSKVSRACDECRRKKVQLHYIVDRGF